MNSEPGNFPDESEPLRVEDWGQRVKLPILEVALFTRQLSVMLAAGVPLRDALESLVRGAEKEEAALVFTTLLKSVENGHPLSKAMRAFPRVFNNIYLSMVKVGEETGMLVDTLRNLADWLEREANLLRQAQSTLTYPILVLSVSILLGIGFLTVIFPGFAETLQSVGDLPALTHVLILLSETLRSPLFWFLASLVLVTGLVGLRHALTTPKNRVLVWRTLGLVPVLSPLLRDLAASRFCSALALMLDTGVDLRRSYRLANTASGSPLMESASAQGLTDISMGTKLSDVLQQSPESFSAIVVGLVTVGEEAASLPEVLHMLSQSLDQDTEHRLEVLSAMTEPILMSIVAIAVALIVVGIALPMYGLVNSQL